jgi:flagellar biosynthesis protein
MKPLAGPAEAGLSSRAEVSENHQRSDPNGVTLSGSPSDPPPSRRPQRPVAVALQFEPGREDLPRVVATGRGSVAEQILELAFANGVKVREDADLAQVLAAVDVDSEIPIEAIVAVAEILAHVYRANGESPAQPLPGQGEQT